jgi:hypothetical protein
MALRRIPGTDREYHLIAFDKRGSEVPDADGSSASQAVLDALADPAAAITDVFILSHGWQGDYVDAMNQYDRWLGAYDPDRLHDRVRPFVVGLHWPSKAWSDRTVRSAAADGLLAGAPDRGDADTITVDDAVDEYADRFGDDPEVRQALRTVLEHVADVDPDQDADSRDRLPTEVADAYRILAERIGAADDDPLLGSGWDADAAFAEAAERREEDADDGLLGDGWFSKLREAILTPLRQLTFWHGKNQAREFGESGARGLVRAIMAATPARVHLLGHSFGTIVVSGAVRGPGSDPEPLPRPVDSLFLVQGAVSLWAFAPKVPRDVGGGRGYFADILDPARVAGPIVATRSKWDHAVGKYYPLAARVAGQFLLGDDLPKFGGIGTYGIQGVPDAVELPPLRSGRAPDGALAAATVHNVDASAVIAALEGASGAHNDLAHRELVQLAWQAALTRTGV